MTPRSPRRAVFSRRAIIAGAGVAPVAVASATSPVVALAPQASLQAPAILTTTQRLVPGSRRAGGYRRIAIDRGEPHVVRAGLGARAAAKRTGRRRGILSFVQISDVHLQDTQSPLRLEPLDRFSDSYLGEDPDAGFAISAHRSQELLSAHVGEAMVRAINKVSAAPVSGLPLSFCIQTGDNSDNGQLNEIRWNIDLLDGGRRIQPDSGDLSTFAGVASSAPANYDVRYWHPEGAPDGAALDHPRDRFGFPRVPGLLAAARRPFSSQGLRMPWYSVFGNHDGLVAGGFGPHVPLLGEVALGNLKLISPPEGFRKDDILNAWKTDYPAFLRKYADTAAVRRVAADPNRRLLSKAEYLDEHFKTSGAPVGHGFTARNRRDRTAYYWFREGPVVVIVLDTVNPNGGSRGSLDLEQYRWLEDVLAKHEDRLVIIASHHNARTLTSGRRGETSPGVRVRRAQVVQRLLKARNVIAWVNGHSHHHEIRRFKHDSGVGGFWEINTASHIDWPQQSRIIELLDNRDGSLSIVCTLLDHAGPRRAGNRIGTVRELASLGRELSLNDWQSRPKDRIGDAGDRNVELLIPVPPKVRI